MILSDQDLEIIRTRPQSTKLWMSVYKPKTILACQVSDNFITTGARVISYGSVTEGSYTNIDADFSMLVGSSAGQSDIGIVRVRSATASSLTVAENSDINWKFGQYLTVIAFVAIDAVYPRLIQDPGDAENVLWYKDYDIPYSDQNSVLGSFPCAGNHRALFLENGEAQSYWSSSGTYNVNEEDLTFAWEFEGGTPTGTSLRDPGYVSYTSPGHYLTKLTVSNESGGDDVTYRYVSIYERPEDGSNNPIDQWEITSINGSRAEGGYTASMTVYSELEDIVPNAVVVIFSDDTYGENRVSLGGNSENNSKIFFVGHILGDTIEYDYKDSKVMFDVATVNRVMKDAEGFSISVESVTSPSEWYELQNMTVTKAIYHFLRWHTTVLKSVDFQYLGKNLPHQYFDTTRENLYDAIAQFLLSGIRGELVSDRQGKLWAEPSVGAVLLPESYFDESLALSNRDWMNSPIIEERLFDEVSYMEIGGIAWVDYGSGTSSSLPLISAAPGIAPAYRGGVDRFQGLILESQASTNILAGNLFANRNAPIKDMAVQLVGSYRNLDIAPIERVSVNVEDSDTNMDIILSNDPFHISIMNFSYNAKKSHLLSRINLSQIKNGFRGKKIDIPEIPPGFEVPPLPPFPPFPPYVPPSVIPIDPPIPLNGIVTTHIKGKGFWYTEDVTVASPVWEEWNDGLEFINYRDNVYGFFDISHVSGRAYMFGQGLQEVWTSEFPGEPWTLLADSSFFDIYRIPAFGSFTSSTIRGLIVDRESPDRIMCIVSQRFGSKYYETQLFIGSSSGLTLVGRLDDDLNPGEPWEAKGTGMGVYGDSKWLYAQATYTKIISRFPNSGAEREYWAELDGSTGAATGIMIARGGRGGAAAAVWKSVPLQITTNNGSSFFTITGTNAYQGGVSDWFVSAGISYAGDRGLIFNSDGDLEYSQDGGVTWDDASLLGWSGTNGRAIENCGEVTGWILSGDSLVYYTDDDLSFFEDKTGNLGQLMSGTYESYSIRYMGG